MTCEGVFSWPMATDHAWLNWIGRMTKPTRVNGLAMYDFGDHACPSYPCVLGLVIAWLVLHCELSFNRVPMLLYFSTTCGDRDTQETKVDRPPATQDDTCFSKGRVHKWFQPIWVDVIGPGSVIKVIYIYIVVTALRSCELVPSTWTNQRGC